VAIETLTGNDVVLHVNTGTAGSPVYELFGYQRGVSYEQAREMIDASHKGSDHAQSVYGRQSTTLTLDALVPNPDIGAVATHQALFDAQNDKTSLLVRYIRGAGSAGEQILESEALVGTITEEGPDNDVATISVELTLQAPLTLV
jgi:hypothetical protein